MKKKWVTFPISCIFEYVIGENLFDRPDEVYHVTVMPCYDKKLEAVRDDFVFEVEQEDANKNGLRIAEVDSVLTTGEVLDLIKVRLRFPIMAVYVSFVASFFFFFHPPYYPAHW